VSHNRVIWPVKMKIFINYYCVKYLGVMLRAKLPCLSHADNKYSHVLIFLGYFRFT
jgi:hypothetical protein